MAISSKDSGARLLGVWILALLLTGFVTLSEMLVSVPQLPHLQNEVNNNIYPIGFLQEFIDIKTFKAFK